MCFVVVIITVSRLARHDNCRTYYDAWRSSRSGFLIGAASHSARPPWLRRESRLVDLDRDELLAALDAIGTRATPAPGRAVAETGSGKPGWHRKHVSWCVPLPSRRSAGPRASGQAALLT
jgi:hypothetical protein